MEAAQRRRALLCVVKERIPHQRAVTEDPDILAFARAMGERNWVAPSWPREGFEVLDAEALHVLEEELHLADAPFYAISTTMMVANVIKAVGSEELRAEILPKVITGEVTIALGMSEPEAGSDVAAVQTRAYSTVPTPR